MSAPLPARSADSLYSQTEVDIVVFQCFSYEMQLH